MNRLSSILVMDDGRHDASIDQIWIERACERLLHRYFRLIDGGRASDCLELLGPAPVVEAAGKRWEGRDAIAEALRVRESQTDRRTRHAATNVVVDVDGEAATATATLVVFATDGDHPTMPFALSDLEMRYVRVDGEWRIQLHRSLRLAEVST